MILNFTAIESFFWVAQLSSFRAAAELLHVSQPTISYRIRELETDLGTTLFFRKGRGIELTSDGHALSAYVERMMSIASDIEANISVRKNLTQPVRIGVIDSFAVICLPALLKRIDKMHPDLRVSVSTDNSHALAAKLSTGAIDMAILSTPPHLPGIDLISLGRQEINLISSPKLNLNSKILTSEKIAKLRIFSTPAPSNLHYLILGSLGKDPGFSLQINECNSLVLILNFICEGLGVSLLPTRIAQDELANGTLELVNPSVYKFPYQEVYIAHNNGIINRSVKSVASMIKDVSGENKYCF